MGFYGVLRSGGEGGGLGRGEEEVVSRGRGERGEGGPTGEGRREEGGSQGVM